MDYSSAHDNLGCQSCSQKQVVGIDTDLLPSRIKPLINRYVNYVPITNYIYTLETRRNVFFCEKGCGKNILIVIFGLGYISV